MVNIFAIEFILHLKLNFHTNYGLVDALIFFDVTTELKCECLTYLLCKA